MDLADIRSYIFAPAQKSPAPIVNAIVNVKRLCRPCFSSFSQSCFGLMFSTFNRSDELTWCELKFRLTWPTTRPTFIRSIVSAFFIFCLSLSLSLSLCNWPNLHNRLSGRNRVHQVHQPARLWPTSTWSSSGCAALHTTSLWCCSSSRSSSWCTTTYYKTHKEFWLLQKQQCKINIFLNVVKFFSLVSL